MPLICAIDCTQFFTSKKRKAPTPHSKPGRNEKDGRTIEGSPSAKGTLDSYLVTSQEDNNSNKPSRAACNLLARQDHVKRNLSLEINSSLKDERDVLFLPSKSEAAEVLDATQNGMLQDLLEVGDVADVGLGKSDSSLVQGPENSEIKKFANDFLSLYCRY